MVLTIFLISAYSFYPPFFYKIIQALIVNRNMTILLIIIDFVLQFVYNDRKVISMVEAF